MDKAVVRLFKWLPARKRWDLLAASFTDSTGSVTFARKPDATTSYALAYFGVKKIGRSHSSEVTVTVVQ